MTKNEIILTTKLVGDIEGSFYVSSYQRGYRWGKEEVKRLLEDIYVNGDANYCLQPIVVKKKDDKYELIDGQQRLTTIYLIYHYFNASSNGFMPVPKFSLEYKTREKSAEYLKLIDATKKEENIDFWHLYNAYETISKWFEQKGDKRQSSMTAINQYFDNCVKIIWYEVDDNEDSISLFTRLNIGKIPLTSSELVKALFLRERKDKSMTKEKQEEISLQWDNIEKDLHNDALWFFLTNRISNEYQTRIDLILDLFSGKQTSDREKYYTFFKIDEMAKSEELDEIWKKIQRTFLLLKDWFEDHELYHKIGYLVASSSMTLNRIFEESKGRTKDIFREKLDEYIKKSIVIKGNYADLLYTNSSDYRKISNLLLLFNVESVRQNGEHTQWFPFEKFKCDKNNKVIWSLEHIHAQNSESLKTQEMWKEWLKLHIPSVKSVDSNQRELLQQMRDAIAKQKLDRAEFESLQQKVLEILSVKGNVEFMHSIGNLALLNSSDNAALSNSTFDVKRNAIIEMDKKGQYIPFCTKMVFLKYYTPSEKTQIHFWGQSDRVAYIKAINEVLKDYLAEKINKISED